MTHLHPGLVAPEGLLLPAPAPAAVQHGSPAALSLQPGVEALSALPMSYRLEKRDSSLLVAQLVLPAALRAASIGLAAAPAEGRPVGCGPLVLPASVPETLMPSIVLGPESFTVAG